MPDPSRSIRTALLRPAARSATTPVPTPGGDAADPPSHRQPDRNAPIGLTSFGAGGLGDRFGAGERQCISREPVRLPQGCEPAAAACGPSTVLHCSELLRREPSRLRGVSVPHSCVNRFSRTLERCHSQSILGVHPFAGASPPLRRRHLVRPRDRHAVRLSDLIRPLIHPLSPRDSHSDDRSLRLPRDSDGPPL